MNKKQRQEMIGACVQIQLLAEKLAKKRFSKDQCNDIKEYAGYIIAILNGHLGDKND